MTTEELKAAAAVMIGAAEGKKVQFRYRGRTEWSNKLSLDELEFNWSAKEYRLAPEPREWWINVYPAGNVCAHSSRKNADTDADYNRIECVVECVHVREVLEGGE